MARKILDPNQVNDMHELLETASCGIDNLFAGTAESPTGIHDAEECFTKRDLSTLHKAADTIDRLQSTFDGSQKQKRRPS